MGFQFSWIFQEKLRGYLDASEVRISLFEQSMETGIYTAAISYTLNSKEQTQARIKPTSPKTSQNFLVPDVYKTTKVQEDGRENWYKINFPFQDANLNFSQRFQILIGFSHKRARICR